MKKNRIFSDPNPNFKFTSKVSPINDGEDRIMEYFDPLEEDPIKNLAGFIARSAVDIARYDRSIRSYPEKTEHFQRLIRAATFMAQTRAAATAEAQGSNALMELESRIAEIDWSDAEYIPRINQNHDQPLGFIPSYTTWYENGGMDEAVMQPGEASRVSFCCGGGVHNEDRPFERY